MELALVLVLVVLVELALTFYLLGRVRDYRRRVSKLERNVSQLANVVKDWDSGAAVSSDKAIEANDFASLLEGVTEKDIKQAKTVLAAFGVEQD